MPMSSRLLRPIASVVHPEAAAWRTAVVANGGSVSASTMRAVSTFCSAIDSAGIRDRFYRLNLFAGDSDASLNAVRTPLYRGPSRTGTQFGNATDTNANFVSGDYSESSGLKGNGSTKHLLTGLLPSDIGTAQHLAISVSADTTVNTFALGCDNAFDAGWTSCVIDFLATVTQGGGASGLRARGNTASNNGSVSASIFTSANAYRALVTSARTSGAGMSMYESGVLSETRSPTYQTFPAFEFAVFGGNRKGTIVGRSPVRLSSYSIGLDMTGAQAAAYNTALVAFLTALGRPTA